jgi:regulatory protein
MAARRRAPKKIDDAWLQRSALNYLRRFTPTTARFRRVMMRKVDRALAAGTTADREETAERLEALILRLGEAGYLDDERLVRARVQQLHERGTSAQLIRARLAQQEAPSELVDASLAEMREEGRDLELEAAVAYARRRRLGPWSRQPGERRERELGSLARAGFGYAVALKILDADSTDELDELVDRA